MAEPVYTMRWAMHGRLDRGGYLHVYEIVRDGVQVGTMSVRRATRQSPEHTVLAATDGTEYATKEQFKAAVEASIAAAASKASDA